MKENSQAVSINHPDQFNLEDDLGVLRDQNDPSDSWDLHTTTTDEKTEYNKPGGIALGSIKKNMMHSFTTWWERLITAPESFSQSDDTPLSKMVIQKESQIYENELVNGVMSRFLNLAVDSVELSRAVKKSNKIFHEDFPGNYILEYNGKRIGMFCLRAEAGLNNSLDVGYEFYPKVQSFM